jgi:hypothetical protein
MKKLGYIVKNESGFYWLYQITDNSTYLNDKDAIDGDSRLYVVKDMAKRWGYKIVTPIKAQSIIESF